MKNTIDILNYLHTQIDLIENTWGASYVSNVNYTAVPFSNKCLIIFTNKQNALIKTLEYMYNADTSYLSKDIEEVYRINHEVKE